MPKGGGRGGNATSRQGGNKTNSTVPKLSQPGGTKRKGRRTQTY